MIPLSPLEPWIKSKICLKAAEPLTRPLLEAYQLGKLRETISRVRAASPFYRKSLAGFSENDIRTLADLACLPFTFPTDIIEDDRRFICVPMGEIERVVTLASSGTTAAPKRIHFTSADLGLTIDFFQHGMSTLVGPGDRVLVLMPGELPGSVGDLLIKGLKRMDVTGIVHGPVRDPAATLATIADLDITSLVGLPGQVLALVRHPGACKLTQGQIRSVLLSADYVPDAVIREIERVWGCPVFNHYGMTETGLGGGVDCRSLSGYHLREADLYFEIVDPVAGRPLPDGEVGEVVFTTLTRAGMPLIRYRTGDLARFIAEPCPCGTVLRRLDHVRGRLGDRKLIGNNTCLESADLSEALYSITGLVDYRATVMDGDGRDLLALDIQMWNTDEAAAQMIRAALLDLPAIGEAVASGSLAIGTIGFVDGEKLYAGVAKKIIHDNRIGGD
ncbi:MAG TPA: AMP-binding protein [Geobacteraceae bacterium]|nr:AMP-binding protein [Geobacteraceae bacterium]